MIVYIKKKNGELYASPVFAQIGKSWKTKCVVLNEEGDGLILQPLLLHKSMCKISAFNLFYIDETMQDGWIEKRRVSGFPEIIENKTILKALKRGKTVSIEGINAVKLYNLPLPVITDFQIKTEKDIETFNTICWGLHDAYIESITEYDKDLIVNFNTTWSKHIIMTFHGVIFQQNLDALKIVFDCCFEMEPDSIKWLPEECYDPVDAFVIAKSISYKLLID